MNFNHLIPKNLSMRYFLKKIFKNYLTTSINLYRIEKILLNFDFTAGMRHKKV